MIGYLHIYKDSEAEEFFCKNHRKKCSCGERIRYRYETCGCRIGAAEFTDCIELNTDKVCLICTEESSSREKCNCFTEKQHPMLGCPLPSHRPKAITSRGTCLNHSGMLLETEDKEQRVFLGNVSLDAATIVRWEKARVDSIKQNLEWSEEDTL